MTSENDAKWFLQHNGKVQGPFDHEALNELIQSMGDESSSSALVWSRGLSEWVKANKWKNIDLSQITTQLSTQTSVPYSTQLTSFDARPPIQPVAQQAVPPSIKTPIQPPPSPPQPNQSLQNKNAFYDEDGTKTSAIPDAKLFEKTTAQTYSEGVFYQAKLNYIDQPLMSKAELITWIAKQPDIKKILIQNPKTKEWKDLYNFPDILERLGLSRRQLPRVLIMAQFSGKSTNTTEPVTYRVINISQSGVGFTESYDLRIGDEVEGQISSPHFFQPLHIKAEVVYAGQDGYIGLKFIQIPDEALATIIDYVKKFSKNPANIT